MARYKLTIYTDDDLVDRQLIFKTKDELIDWFVEMPHTHIPIIRMEWRRI